jgi:multiple sugar transport system permease protein/putative aldouronate transport system permease protein
MRPVYGDGMKEFTMDVNTTLIKKRNMRLSIDDKVYYLVIYVFVVILFLVVLYPMVYIVSASFSSPLAVSTGQVVLLPVAPGLQGYFAVFRDERIPMGYRNTIFYTVFGTLINISMTLICAYPLARKRLPHRGLITFFFTFTMLFSGGMIPNYLLLRDLRMLNTFWAMLIPGAISVYSMIITRTFLQNVIPDELLEATQIDGCNDFRFFFSFVIPLSKAVIAVIAMQYAVGHWNAYFNAFIYLTKKELYPLQVFLREILVMNQIAANDVVDPETAIGMQGLADLLKYSLIVISSAPILCIYPFFQKYFVKGIMIGSLKG